MEAVNFLLVDDREENLISLAALLKRDELNLLQARSGAEALELLLQHDVALALVDVQMPEMDGFELAEIMRGNQRSKNIPIIFVTASHTEQSRRFRGYEAGAVDFISKPIESNILRSKANVFFELYRQRQEVAYQRDQLAVAWAENERLLKETRDYAQALQEADKRKNEFLATLSHELRNPMTPLRNGIEILQRQPNLENRDQIYSTISRELDHMVCLVNDLLDISRVREGKINLHKEPVKLTELVQFALESGQEAIRRNRHELIVNLPEQELWVDADPVRLVQVLSNVISNAAKYTPPGGKITVEVWAETESEQKEKAVIQIADTGVGIPSEMLNNIFELFTQVGPSAGYREGGLGIGLSLARKLVDLHGGEIVAKSEGPEQGSTFSICLPTIAAPASSQVEVEEGELHPEHTFNILVVDDNRSAADTMAMMIELVGHKVSTAYTGEQALDMAADLMPQAILLDIGLPDISGYEVARRLRKDSRFDSTLLVAQTGWGQQSDKDAAFEAGFDHHFVKPVKLDSIVALLQERLLQRR